jgi:hypothetical protein
MVKDEMEWDRGGVDQRVRMLCRALPGKKMDQTRLTQLLEATGQQGQIELKVLHNAVISCIKDYQNDSTASRLKDWKAAEKALEEKIDVLWSQHFGRTEQALETIADVLDYLAPGWKVTKTSLYRHQKEGKFLPQADGTFLQKDIDRYAKAWLRQKSTGKRISEKVDELQRKKLEKELQSLDLEYERKKFGFEKDQEKYIPKGQMEIELAARAGILDAGLKHWIQSRAADWIRTAGGDMKKVGELINLMNRDLDEHINSYAASTEYLVIIDAEEETLVNEAEAGEAVE